MSWTLKVRVIPLRPMILGFDRADELGERPWRWRMDLLFGPSGHGYYGIASGLEETEDDARKAGELAKVELADVLRGLEDAEQLQGLEDQ